MGNKFLIMDQKKIGMYFKGFTEPKGYSSWCYDENKAHIFNNLNEAKAIKNSINNSVIIDFKTKEVINEEKYVAEVQEVSEPIIHEIEPTENTKDNFDFSSNVEQLSLI
ncbi:MAG: hypothetical protein QXG00_07855 [Candidatus Woesearchaeota archaeon]